MYVINLQSYVSVFCRKHIEVHGRPTPAVFRSSPDAGGRSTYQLLWTVDSYSPIQEYRLLYRQIQPYHKVRTFLTNELISIIMKTLDNMKNSLRRFWYKVKPRKWLIFGLIKKLHSHLQIYHYWGLIYHNCAINSRG